MLVYEAVCTWGVRGGRNYKRQRGLLAQVVVPCGRNIKPCRMVNELSGKPFTQGYAKVLGKSPNDLQGKFQKVRNLVAWLSR